MTAERKTIKAWAIYRDGEFYAAYADPRKCDQEFELLTPGSKHKWTQFAVEVSKPHER